MLFETIASPTTQAMRGRLIDDPVGLAELAAADAALRAAHAGLISAVDDVWTLADARQHASRSKQALVLLAVHHAIDTAVDAVSVAHRLCGGAALFRPPAVGRVARCPHRPPAHLVRPPAPSLALSNRSRDRREGITVHRLARQGSTAASAARVRARRVRRRTCHHTRRRHREPSQAIRHDRHDGPNPSPLTPVSASIAHRRRPACSRQPTPGRPGAGSPRVLAPTCATSRAGSAIGISPHGCAGDRTTTPEFGSAHIEPPVADSLSCIGGSGVSDGSGRSGAASWYPRPHRIRSHLAR